MSMSNGVNFYKPPLPPTNNLQNSIKIGCLSKFTGFVEFLFEDYVDTFKKHVRKL